MLFNNILAPCLAIAVVSPACFFNAFYAADAITSSYLYCVAFFGILGKSDHVTCTEKTYSYITFDPPFVYSYMCSSLLPVNYVVIYLYMVLISGFAIPTSKIVLKYLYDHILQKDGVWYERVGKMLPLSMSIFYANPDSVPSQYMMDVSKRSTNANLDDKEKLQF
jgi:hypothetical protein